MEKMEIERNGKISVHEIEDIRRSVNWRPFEGRYKTAMKNTYSHFTIRQKGKLIAFARVVSDGSIYGLLVDVIVRPEFQNKGVGERLVRHIIKSMREDGIKFIGLIFMPKDKKLGHFYRKLGFEIFKAGDIELNE